MSIAEVAPLGPDYEAADGRFFVPNGGLTVVPDAPARKPFLDYSRYFHWQYDDLLLDGSGVVMGAGLEGETPIGHQTPLEAVQAIVTGTEVASLDKVGSSPRHIALLGFAMVQSDRHYAWEVNLASRQDGRQLLQLHVIRNGLLAARQTHDRQGNLVSIDLVDPAPVIGIIHHLANSKLIDEQADKLRHDQRVTEQHLNSERLKIGREQIAAKRQGSSEVVCDHLAEKREKESEILQKQLDDTGFKRLKLQKLLSDYQNWWLSALA